MMAMFDKIDTFLENKKESELLLIYIGVFLVIAMIAYLYIYPFSEKVLTKTKSQLYELKGKISREQAYIASKTVNGDSYYYIKKAKSNLEKSKEKLQNTIFINGYIDEKLRKLSYLLYNDVNWANFLDNITKNAKKYHVSINLIKNTFHNLNYKKVEQALDVEVDANGKFHNIMKFINSIEESDLIVDIQAMTMDVKNNIHVDFDIAVWGIKY